MAYRSTRQLAHGRLDAQGIDSSAWGSAAENRGKAEYNEPAKENIPPQCCSSLTFFVSVITVRGTTLLRKCYQESLTQRLRIGISKQYMPVAYCRIDAQGIDSSAGAVQQKHLILEEHNEPVKYPPQCCFQASLSLSR